MAERAARTSGRLFQRWRETLSTLEPGDAATVVDIPLSAEATSFLQGALKGGGRGELSVALAISADGSITSFIPQAAKAGTPFGAEPLNNVIVRSPQAISVMTYEGVLATVVCWPTADSIYQCRRY